MHKWAKSSTQKGTECRRCGKDSYLISQWDRAPAGPCCGEFGECKNSYGHDWQQGVRLPSY